MKGRVPHGIPLNDAALAVLERRRGNHKVYVFPSPDSGQPYTKASNRAWYSALRRSKLKGTGVVWHTLRYWCGLVRNPAKYLGLKEWANEFALVELSPKFAYMLRLGEGCDAYFGPEANSSSNSVRLQSED